MPRWSIETHTFVTARGEFALTLEDVALLTLPMHGEAQKDNLSVSMGKTSRESRSGLLSIKDQIFDEQIDLSVMAEILCDRSRTE